MGVEFCLGQLKSLEMDTGDDCTTLEMYSVPLNFIPKNGQNGQFHVMLIVS